ncbi:NAD(P)-binding protein [Thelephora ganbajun]|uniref:NAD(P)-binding protein n=1 Tax=Thelephora ganbajun TaxID=370292 RepID=A0ACB6ZKS2_THEGA|nr:NAD(P)-binding protein [Thelephora ganbajun]
MDTVISFVKGNPISAFFYALGSFTFLKFAIKTLVVFGETFVLPGTNLRKFGAGKGSWAVITGASDGIGREYSIQLAKKGFNVLAVARNGTALKSVTDEIASGTKGKVQSKTVVLDVSKSDHHGWEQLKEVFHEIQVSVLVNNVGKSHAHPVYFAESEPSEISDIIAINVDATVRITRMVLPGMIKRKNGLILNMGSFSGIVPSPMLATYSGTKAFIDTFSTALAEEVKKHGITVQCINPYFVVSKMSKIRKPSIMIPTAAAFVRASLNKVGLSGGARFVGRPAGSAPYWSHSLLEYFVGVLGWKQATVVYTHELHKSIRKRVDRKLAREAKTQ